MKFDSQDLKRKFDMLKHTLEQEEKTKRDMQVNLSDLFMSKDGLIRRKSRNGVSGLELSDYAMTQAFNRIGIPVKYGKKLMAERPDLVADQFNHWVSTDDRGVLIRMRINEDGTGFIRGFLSDKYSILDNIQVFESLEKVLQQSPTADLASFYIDDKRAHMRITFPDLTTDFGISTEGKHDVIQVGVDIVNSEVGASSLRVTPLVFRLVCLNGLKVWSADGDPFVQRHIHLTSNELFGRMNTAIVDAIKGGDEMLETLNNVRKIKVDNPLSVIEELAKKQMYSQNLIDQAKTNFMIEPENSLYGVVNAFTRTARDLPNERRLEVEAYAGEILKLQAV